MEQRFFLRRERRFHSPRKSRPRLLTRWISISVSARIAIQAAFLLGARPHYPHYLRLAIAAHILLSVTCAGVRPANQSTATNHRLLNDEYDDPGLSTVDYAAAGFSQNTCIVRDTSSEPKGCLDSGGCHTGTCCQIQEAFRKMPFYPFERRIEYWDGWGYCEPCPSGVCDREEATGRAHTFHRKNRRYEVGSGTIYDPETKLTWQQTVSSTMFTLVDAKTYCAGAAAGLGGTGWRLPTIEELKTIVDDTRDKPSIDVAAFPSTPADRFWSSSPVAGSPSNAWAVYFDHGEAYSFDVSLTGYVRCVRSGRQGPA